MKPFFKKKINFLKNFSADWAEILNSARAKKLPSNETNPTIFDQLEEQLRFYEDLNISLDKKKIVFSLQNHIFQWRGVKIKSKSIFQWDWALIMQLEHEKCLEIMFHRDAQNEPNLIHISQLSRLLVACTLRYCLCIHVYTPLCMSPEEITKHISAF